MQRWRSWLVIAAVVVALSASAPGSAAGFGTIDRGGQNREHERITRAALACAKPVVAYESAWADAMVGPAAYLVPPGGGAQAGSRALGAALITVVVEESVAEELSQAARLRSAQWGQAEFGERLAEAYRQLALR